MRVPPSLPLYVLEGVTTSLPLLSACILLVCVCAFNHYPDPPSRVRVGQDRRAETPRWIGLRCRSDLGRVTWGLAGGATRSRASNALTDIFIPSLRPLLP